jgi:hypothetical protein
MRFDDLRNRLARTALAAAGVSLGLLLAPGCGDGSGLEPRYAVSGKLTYKGEPVKNAVINFVPVGGGRGATGKVDEGGAYTLTTHDPDDGALPGKYKVTVDDRQPDEAKMKEKTAALAKKTNMKPGIIPQEIQAAAFKTAKGVVPGKYQLAETSDVEVEVKPQANSINIELKD